MIPDSPLSFLTRARAEVGNFAKAIETANQAIEVAKSADDPPFTSDLQGQIEGYKQGRAYREPRF